MGVAYYVVLQREIPGLDQWDMDGEQIAESWDELADAAAQLKLISLDEFLSASPEEIESFLGMEPIEEEEATNLPDEMRAQIRQLNEEMNRALVEAQTELEEAIASTGGKIPDEAWFRAEDGLQTVRELMGYVGVHAADFAASDDLIDALKNLEEILQTAAENDVKFHLALDY